jgi:ribosomal protein S18 acetylase RimI-like enzyme
MHTPSPFARGDLAFRAPTADDAPHTFELIVRNDVHEYGEPDLDLEDLTLDWEQIDVARDAWLVATATGRSVGYGAVVRWKAELRYDIYVEPLWTGQDLDRALLARCEARGQEMAQERDQDLLARIYLPHANRQKHEILAGTGFGLTRYHFQMEMRLDGPPPAPAWPEGVSVRTAAPVQDGRAIHRLVETAFARPGRTPTTYAEWQGLLMGGDSYSPDLWFLAVAGGAIVGACLSFAYPGQGWVRQLAVAQEWRRQGIGTALLHHAFGAFRERRYDRVGLAVDAENANAYAFYQQVGMQRVRQYDVYERTIERPR